MTTCSICRFETELDDVVVAREGGHCICLRCFTHETESDRPMPKALRRELIAVLAALEVA
jgi:hypothetical protein